MQALIGLIRTMRPKQWTKNVLFVFPALIFDGQLFVLDSFLRVFAAFILLCFMSSTVYIINDLVDIESDRQHPVKRNRALPSGQLSIPLAIGAAFLMPIVVLAVAFSFSVPLATVLVVYLLLQLAYSFRLKHIVIVDLLVLTFGFVLRVVAGVVVIQVENFSPWLYVCTGLLALFLAVSKRRQEIILLGGNGQAAQVRRIYKDYTVELLDKILGVVVASTFITYTLYTIETPSRLMANRYMGLLTVPFVIYGLFRYMYLIYVRGETAPPDEVLLKDRPMQIDIVLFAISFVLILYVFPSVQ